MAGSYLHLHLAIGAFPAAFGATAPQDPQAHAAFLAGSLGPDLGYFPGGPAAFSHRVHHDATADLVRALLASARSDAEEAFAAGWALHVHCDVATHPLINEQADRCRQQLSRQPPARLDLWHKRVEWGLDCTVLESTGYRPALWRQPLLFPAEAGGASLLGRAAQAVYGAVDDGQLRRGWASLETWVRRLAPLFGWTGSCRLPGVAPPVASALLRPAARGLGRLLASRPTLEDAAAIASPVRADDPFIGRVLPAAVGAVAAFQRSYAGRFAQMANLDLDTGAPIPARR